MKKLIAILLAAATLTAASVTAFAENEEVAPAEQNAARQVEPVEEKEGKTEVETPAPAEEKAEETLPVEEAPVEQPAEQKATPDEQPETPEINSEEIKNFLASDEVKSALREAGLDEDEIEDVTENPESEIIYISQEEYEQMRRDYAKTAFSGAKYILLIPATPIMFFIPFAGPLMCGVILASPIALIGGLGALIASPVVALVLYNSFKLEPPYELEK